jgi:sugar phosphate permease
LSSTAGTKADSHATAPHQHVHGNPTSVRYRVLGLSFFMAFMMYMERGAIGAATPYIMKEFHIDKTTMGLAVSAFNWAYALCQVPAGWLADRFGPRLILSIAMAWWAVFTAGTGMTWNAISLATTRMLFGAGEAAAFPAGSRAMVRWLPVSQRAFGQGFQHSGSRLGAALAPIIVVALMAPVGWRAVFYGFGIAGTLWAVGWYWYYRNTPGEHPSVNEAELALLQGAAAKKASAQVPWAIILRSVDLWCLSIAYFCYGYILWLFLQWFPTYLREYRHFTALGSTLAAMPLFAATLTNVLGGIASDRLTVRWKDLRKGRLAVAVAGYLIAALGLLVGATTASGMVALLCMTCAMGGTELTVAVSWAVCIDLGGEYAGSVAAVMNTLGNIGGAISAMIVGFIAAHYGWTSPFLLGSAVCLFSALLMCRVDPRKNIA